MIYFKKVMGKNMGKEDIQHYQMQQQAGLSSQLNTICSLI